METLVSELDYKSDDYYHNTEEHGPMWTLLHQMLHVIVLGYTLFGLIRFKVIFIRMVTLVRWISLTIVGLNCYISVKFGVLATIFYFFNVELDSRQVGVLQFNCSLDRYEDFLLQNNVTSQATTYAMMADLLHHIGGPYRLLGNRATLMYGFFCISIYIMLALFPLEHYYFDIGFNYIRFVLNDAGCMRDCYAKKQRHAERLNSWSWSAESSLITRSLKQAVGKKDLRSSYVYEEFFCEQAAPTERRAPVGGHEETTAATTTTGSDGRRTWHDLPPPNKWLAKRNKASLAVNGEQVRGDDDDDGILSGKEKEMAFAPVKSLRHALLQNHQDEPSYNVRVANKNLKRFKPYVRSESWFKISMVIYPIFIFYYFTSLMVIIGAITIFVTNTLRSVNDLCVSGLNSRGFHETASQLDLSANWSLWDRMTCLEGRYSVFALSCASSFYCSYYFGTILELLIWIEEISQQLTLSRIVVEFMEARPPPLSLVGDLAVAGLPHPAADDGNKAASAAAAAAKVRSQSGAEGPIQKTDINSVLESLFQYHDDGVRDAHLIDKNFNHFGGLNSIWAHCKLRMASQSERLRKYELMAIKLAAKKQTILRSCYINLNMFFDELNDTRFMTTIILRRTTQIAFAFAMMVSVTRSQFEFNVIYLSVLLLSCLAILNLYLICAAFINSSINKLAPQIHRFIGACMSANTDHDLLEFWLRHIQTSALDKDALSYRIYGYKITWSSILNFNGAVSSVYLFTVY